MRKTAVFLALTTNLIGLSAQQWSLTGNSGINSGNFLGTSDSSDLVLKTNNQERIKIESTGSVVVNASTYMKAVSQYNNTLDVLNDLDNNSPDIDLIFLRYGKYQPNNPSVMTVSGMTTPTNYEAFFNLRANGKLGLGTYNFQTCTDCANYRLFVKDGIKTEKVKVEIAANNGWADYVFEKDYKLMDLTSLENYIKVNKHLPEVPTTEDAIKNGIELKEMNILLLKKVEELTLHVINLNNELQTLKSKK